MVTNSAVTGQSWVLPQSLKKLLFSPAVWKLPVRRKTDSIVIALVEPEAQKKSKNEGRMGFSTQEGRGSVQHLSLKTLLAELLVQSCSQHGTQDHCHQGPYSQGNPMLAFLHPSSIRFQVSLQSRNLRFMPE